MLRQGRIQGRFGSLGGGDTRERTGLARRTVRLSPPARAGCRRRWNVVVYNGQPDGSADRRRHGGRAESEHATETSPRYSFDERRSTPWHEWRAVSASLLRFHGKSSLLRPSPIARHCRPVSYTQKLWMGLRRR